jgi:hypothetical protein
MLAKPAFVVTPIKKNGITDYLKIGKTLHPTPHTPHPASTNKLFAANPSYSSYLNGEIAILCRRRSKLLKIVN